MSEYIYGTDGHEGHWLTGEQVVRCRDCGKWDAEGEPHAIHPERHWCDELARYVEPDGFCKWGEHRGDWVTCKCGEEIEATSGWVVCPSCGRRWMNERR